MSLERKTLLSAYQVSANKQEFFVDLSLLQKLNILQSLSKKARKELLEHLHEDNFLEVLKNLDPDEITDILQVLSPKKQQRILLKLNKDVKNKVDLLLQFTPTTAAGVMNLNYIEIDEYASKKEIENRVKNHLLLGKREPTILVLNSQRDLLGELRLSTLLLEKRTELRSYLRKLPTIHYNTDQEECIDLFKKHKHDKVVVFDDENRIMGLIHARNVLKIIEEENTEDFYGIAGLQKEEDITDSPTQKIKYRFRWLAINLGTAFLAAFVVSLFEETISKVVILAAFMPIVAGMGGNAGTQTTAILVRSLALKKIDRALGKRILLNELIAAFVNGILIGIFVGIIALVLGESMLFGLVAATAILGNLIVASVFGTIVPLTLKAFDIDPASSSSVFVTTTTDVFGFFLFLGLATVFLL